MTRRILHFTLGPVQGFIADARRTRDLWAGSFLLSWLSGQAMAAVVEAAEKGGADPSKVIIFPAATGDDLFEAIREQRSDGRTDRSPYVGSLPNRFKADVTGVSGNPGEICERAIMETWKQLADAVWNQFLGPRPGFADVANDETKVIWDRQVNGFWDITWVAGEAKADGASKPVDGSWLDQRKNWRAHFPLDVSGKPVVERGDLCRVMGHYQEVSGFPRIGGKDKQDKFYAALRARQYDHPGGKRGLNELNIGDTERLSSLALIKRLFPLLNNVDEVIGWRPGGDAVNIVNWPSVSYIAAVPWLKGIASPSLQGARGAHFDSVENSVVHSYKGETDTRLFDLPDESFFKLDGHLLHEDGIRAWKLDDFRGDSDNVRRDNRSALLETHSKLCTALKVESPAGANTKPSEFYAVLLMDGDRIGAKIRDHERVVKSGLAWFAKSVKEYFDRDGTGTNPANGVLIYAGGDDVLALTPVDTAIETARYLRGAYQRAFEAAIADEKSDAKEEDFSLSGVIVFAQYKIPLRAVLDEAHHHLDGIAKEKNGRDSLAIAVMKPGGIAFDWVSCWTSDPVETMEMIARDRSDYSSSFFYNIRERYAPLFTGDNPGTLVDVDQNVFDVDFMQAILMAEYKKQKETATLSAAAIAKKIAPLLTIGRPFERSTGRPLPSAHYALDSALVARFIAGEGRWNLSKGNAAGGDGNG